MTHEREHEDVRRNWFAEILNSTLNDLAYAEQVITSYAAQEPDGFIAWGMAEGEAVQAHQALRRAPTLRTAITTGYDAVNATADVLFALAGNISQSLVRAAELANDPDDKSACLQAALHSGRLRDALR
ncbi:hypothetical protein GCM10022254_52690 [Actinomadura meridiana]|uniref:Uncharacterized protein n=1 Tax=Actinomadura meridiana TaxID=559626 RepID=A0ABP8CDZ0_9ACTN